MTECPYFANGFCVMAQTLGGLAAETTERACQSCQSQPNPRTANCTTISLAINTRLQQRRSWVDLQQSRTYYCGGAPPIPEPGPGAELKRLIPDFFQSKGCGCKDYARKMDRWGVEGCRERFDEIVNHLVAQAAANTFIGKWKGMSRVIARRWVNQAIEAAAND